MPMLGKSGKPKAKELPSTVRRSGKKAQRTFAKAHDSAMEQYGGDEERAYRVAYSALKHTHEKVGDRWEKKEGGRRGPSDAKDEARYPQSGEVASAGGVDTHATKEHLLEQARALDVEGRSTMTKAELIEALQKANDRATRASREAREG